MVCMKREGVEPDILCDCYWFDDGKEHILPLRKGGRLGGAQQGGAEENKIKKERI